MRKQEGFYDDDRPPSGAIYNWKQGGFVGTWTARGETIPISAEDHAERMARKKLPRNNRNGLNAKRPAPGQQRI